MIVSVTLNPSVDHALFLQRIVLNDTNRVLRTERDAGGKGVNLSRMVVRLGGNTIAAGFLGGGPGHYVRAVLESHNVPHRFVEVSGPTRVNFSVEDGSGKPPTTFNEPGPEVTPQEVTQLTALVAELLEEATWLTLGGSLPPNLPVEVLIQFIKMAHSSGVRVALDADGEALRMGVAAGPDLVKPNAAEARRLLGRAVSTDREAAQAAFDIRASMMGSGRAWTGGFPVAVLSRGPEPAFLACDEGVLAAQPAVLKSVSTIGCGDSMVAGLVWALDSGLSMKEAFAWGMAAGASTATSTGSDVGSLEDAQRFVESVRVEAFAAGVV